MAKWIDVGDTSRSAAEVAEEILCARLDAVRNLLPLAAHEYRNDVEYVHQLRVGCRRTAAALQAFGPLLGKKSVELKKALRLVRRAAGPARDADVLLERLAGESLSKPCHEFVMSMLVRRRECVQSELSAAASKSHVAKLVAGWSRCQKRLHKRSRSAAAQRFHDFAESAIQKPARHMLEFVCGPQSSVAELHEFRIAGKRLRYSIELFHDVLPEVLRDDVYPIVEEIQSRLGRLNDHATAQALYQHWLSKLPANEQAAQLARRIVLEHEAAVDVRHEFLDWWSTSRAEAFRSLLTAAIKS
ncbi:MAG: CHAD domain-containing protein [Planctomycetota bacterium]